MDKQIIISNLLISYSESGAAGGECLLFLHGWRSSAGVWRNIVESLKLKVESRTCTVDLPGFGKSQTPSQVMGVGDYANVVAEFIKKLELKNVTIVGHSFGGRVGIKLASLHPELISKLVLVDSAGFAMETKRKIWLNAGAKIAKPLFKPKFMRPLRKKIYRHIGAEDYIATPELQQTFIKTVSEDLTADMEKISCSTLIINGADDADTPVEFGRRMNTLIQNSKFKILEHAGHFSFLDKPEEFAEALMAFVAQARGLPQNE